MLAGMAVNLSIDLNDATYGDLVALVDAARTAGADSATSLELDGTTLKVSVAAPSVSMARRDDERAARYTRDPRQVRDTVGFDDRVLPVLGENAVRGIMDILTGRQDPPGAHSR